MYIIRKTFEVSGSHQLNLPYESPCNRLHGHNWRITVEVTSYTLNQEQMVVDFGKIKKLVHDLLDHQDITNRISGNPTAENIAGQIHDRVSAELDTTLRAAENAKVSEVVIQESEGNVAIWRL